RSVERYPVIDLGLLRAPLAEVVRALEAPDGRAPGSVAGTPSTVRVTRSGPPVEAPPPTAAERAAEAAFLDIIDDLAEGSADGYADLREAVDLAERRGIPAGRAETLLNGLEESGVLEEPVVGKLRRA
ncbi:MAG: hypothetical protein L3K06_05655, partial [Thermoplasmata archaeon]|nr:hypothetical protein [Thermoplasmata archaeon]